MSLEQKIDQLIKDLGLLIGKVEQRAKINESYANKASQTISQAEQTVSRATQEYTTHHSTHFKQCNSESCG